MLDFLFSVMESRNHSTGTFYPLTYGRNVISDYITSITSITSILGFSRHRSYQDGNTIMNDVLSLTSSLCIITICISNFMTHDPYTPSELMMKVDLVLASLTYLTNSREMHYMTIWLWLVMGYYYMITDIYIIQDIFFPPANTAFYLHMIPLTIFYFGFIYMGRPPFFKRALGELCISALIPV